MQHLPVVTTEIGQRPARRETGGVNLATIAGWPAWKQRRAVRYAWCEVWLDPRGTGQYRAAWVYGKYIRPA